MVSYKRYGDGGNIFNPDHATTMQEVGADWNADERLKAEALRLLGKGVTTNVNIVPHTLSKADDHAHHLVITNSVGHWDKALALWVTEYRGECKTCGGVDEWTTGEMVNEWASKEGRHGRILSSDHAVA